MKVLRRRPTRARPDPRLGWHVLGGRRHFIVEDALTGLPGPLCGSRVPPDASGVGDPSLPDLGECEGCWEQIEFLRWA